MACAVADLFCCIGFDDLVITKVCAGQLQHRGIAVRLEIVINRGWEDTAKRAGCFVMIFLGCVTALYFSSPVDAHTMTITELWSVILILSVGLVSLLKAIKYFAKSVWMIMGF
jgi:hypothetical protein